MNIFQDVDFIETDGPKCVSPRWSCSRGEQEMACYETGFEDERFQHPVGHTLHCGICLNVLKDPVMCRQNEHMFCRGCVTPHLMYSETCPSCIQTLTVESLREAPRTVTNLLSELKIACDYAGRGCENFVELGNLERHVADCGFAPAVCSNEGCQLVVNKQDLLHHETAVCELRRIISCNEIREEMDTMKVSLAAVNEKLKEVGQKLETRMDKVQENVKAEVGNVAAEVGNVAAEVGNVAAKFEMVQGQLNKQGECINQLKADNAELKKSLNEMTKQLERIAQQMLQGVHAEQMKKDIAEGGMDRDPMVVVAGGWNSKGCLNSVEMFGLCNGKWTMLKPMKEEHCDASSVVYDQVMVLGGYGKNPGAMESIEKLSLNAVHVDCSTTWENFHTKLPEKLQGHCSVVYNGQLILIGGHDASKGAPSDCITEVTLVPPYTTKLLATMPQTRFHHCVAMFGDKILILGGMVLWGYTTILASVMLYDITKNEFQELAPLPYPVCEMAMVKWGDDSAIIAGGAHNNGQALNKVLMYNIKTQKSSMLPDMKYKRRGCVAAVVRNTVIVMGGQGESGNRLKSVECFNFDRYSWEELPEMHEERWRATAVVC